MIEGSHINIFYTGLIQMLMHIAENLFLFGKSGKYPPHLRISLTTFQGNINHCRNIPVQSLSIRNRLTVVGTHRRNWSKVDRIKIKNLEGSRTRQR